MHTGEVEEHGDDLGGIAVHLAARVVDAAAAGEVLVSRTVRDLIAGSGLALEDRGEQDRCLVRSMAHSDEQCAQCRGYLSVPGTGRPLRRHDAVIDCGEPSAIHSSTISPSDIR